jgi:hypothetical protein
MADGPVLVVTNLHDVTADLVITALNRRDVPVVRLDPADIGDGLTFTGRIGGDDRGWSGRLRTDSRDLDLGHVRSVYHRRPGPWRFDHLERRAGNFASAEARHGLTGLLNDLPVPHVNAPLANARAEYKPSHDGRVGIRHRTSVPGGGGEGRRRANHRGRPSRVRLPHPGVGLSSRLAIRFFIECNPNGQWGFLPASDSIADAFAEVLQNG